VLDCFTTDKDGAVPITAVTKDGLSEWLDAQTERIRAWVKAAGFKAGAGKTLLLPGDGGAPSGALLGVKGADDFWSWGAASAALPEGRYSIAGDAHPHAALGWALGCYKFTKYKEAKGKPPVLALADKSALPAINNMAEAIYFARDLINTPSSDMGPGELAAAASALARRFDAECKITVGDDLLRDDYPMIHAVGRASERAPRLIDITWGKPNDPKITLVGKGVCFDTGGLDLKPASSMLNMKKDMGGAAQVLALGQMIMAARLNIRLRILVPAVENSVSGNAFRPHDVLKTRKGISVEIGNTDAEGRLVLGDALTEAISEEPEAVFDFATLTGAARVALGPDISVMFSTSDELAAAVEKAAAENDDPVWRMPLWEPYKRYLESDVADINNAGQSRFAGAVTAALFLKEFAGETVPWAHFDIYAWNQSQRPGRPVGGEAMAIRAIYGMLAEKYGG
jgi:leucyl aminopeptidase